MKKATKELMYLYEDIISIPNNIFILGENMYYALKAKNVLRSVRKLLVKPGVWAVLFYRVGRLLGHKSIISKTFVALWDSSVITIVKIITGIELFSGTEIGRRLLIEHFGGIFISRNVKIGDDCRIYQGVAIGNKDFRRRGEVPVIGNNVTIGAGAKVLGRITVGDNVIIGANSVVISNIPSNVVVAGIPATVKKSFNDGTRREEDS